MASFTITVADVAEEKLVDSLCVKGGWTSESGLTKGEFARKQIKDDLKQGYLTYVKRKQLAENAVGLKILMDTADTEMDVTVE
jgi:hypothetical protein